MAPKMAAMDTHSLPLFRLAWRSAPRSEAQPRESSSSTSLWARLRDAWQRPAPSEEERFLAGACDLADLEQRLRRSERYGYPPIDVMWR